MSSLSICIFFFNDTATTEIYTLSLHDALPISRADEGARARADHGRLLGEGVRRPGRDDDHRVRAGHPERQHPDRRRSEEHTSELQSRQYLVCRLLLEKKKIFTWSTETNNPERP